MIDATHVRHTLPTPPPSCDRCNCTPSDPFELVHFRGCYYCTACWYVVALHAQRLDRGAPATVATVPRTSTTPNGSQ